MELFPVGTSVWGDGNSRRVTVLFKAGIFLKNLQNIEKVYILYLSLLNRHQRESVFSISTLGLHCVFPGHCISPEVSHAKKHLLWGSLIFLYLLNNIVSRRVHIYSATPVSLSCCKSQMHKTSFPGPWLVDKGVWRIGCHTVGTAWATDL